MASLNCSIFIFIIFLFFIHYNCGDSGPDDCQQNEIFVICGTCEGTCKRPVLSTCRLGCSFPRCECILKNGFVRAHDGACIHVRECLTYRGVYYSQSGQLVSNFDLKTFTPKVSNNFLLKTQTFNQPFQENNFNQFNKNINKQSMANN